MDDVQVEIVGVQTLERAVDLTFDGLAGQMPLVEKELKAGQAVRVPADTKHWHGAAPGESFSHLAFMVPTGDPKAISNEWLEPVDAEAYNALS